MNVNDCEYFVNKNKKKYKLIFFYLHNYLIGTERQTTRQQRNGTRIDFESKAGAKWRCEECGDESSAKVANTGGYDCETWERGSGGCSDCCC